MYHLNSSLPSCWFTFHFVVSNFMQKSVVSQNMTDPSVFPLPNRVQYLPLFTIDSKQVNVAAGRLKPQYG